MSEQTRAGGEGKKNWGCFIDEGGKKSYFVGLASRHHKIQQPESSIAEQLASSSSSSVMIKGNQIEREFETHRPLMRQ
jgi:uncharacterized protein YhbP (UPF0306 family)